MAREFSITKLRFIRINYPNRSRDNKLFAITTDTDNFLISGKISTSIKKLEDFTYEELDDILHYHIKNKLQKSYENIEYKIIADIAKKFQVYTLTDAVAEVKWFEAQPDMPLSTWHSDLEKQPLQYFRMMINYRPVIYFNNEYEFNMLKLLDPDLDTGLMTTGLAKEIRNVKFAARF